MPVSDFKSAIHHKRGWLSRLRLSNTTRAELARRNSRVNTELLLLPTVIQIMQVAGLDLICGVLKLATFQKHDTIASTNRLVALPTAE